MQDIGASLLLVACDQHLYLRCDKPKRSRTYSSATFLAASSLGTWPVFAVLADSTSVRSKALLSITCLMCNIACTSYVCTNSSASLCPDSCGSAGPCVINVYINYERKFAFVELRTGELLLLSLLACMSLCDFLLQIREKHGHNFLFK